MLDHGKTTLYVLISVYENTGMKVMCILKVHVFAWIILLSNSKKRVKKKKVYVQCLGDGVQEQD